MLLVYQRDDAGLQNLNIMIAASDEHFIQGRGSCIFLYCCMSWPQMHSVLCGYLEY